MKNEIRQGSHLFSSPRMPHRRRSITGSSPTLVICCLATVFWLAASAAFPVAAQDAADGPPEYILTASDGWPIHVTYFQSEKGRESPVVVMLTAANGNEKTSLTRQVWKDLAVHLQRNDFAVVTVDLRKHGDSVPEQVTSKKQTKVLPVDYRNMVVSDMEAVKAFLLEKHQEEELNIRKTAIVADGASGLVGAAFALTDWNRMPFPDAPRMQDRTPRGQDVRAIVMFSPQMTRGFNAAKILRPLADPRWQIAFRIYHSSEDEGEAKIANRLFRFVELKGEEYDSLRSIEAAAASGVEFFQGRMKNAVQEDLTEFLKLNVKQLSSPWRNRRSPLED